MPNLGTTSRNWARNRFPLPDVDLPRGELVDVPGRGTTFVTDTPGPHEDSPPLVLLHALGCTGLLTWFPFVQDLAQRHRVVTLDQRWHGRGIRSDELSLYDCADDVAALIDHLGLDRPILAGYSMGSIVSQRVWRQHPGHVGGLVLCATTDRFRSTIAERLFHQTMHGAMERSLDLSVKRVAGEVAQPATTSAHSASFWRPDSIHDWALNEFRSTSPWAIGQALSALGTFHSRPWVRRIDVPTAVVGMRHDRLIPFARQRGVAQRIPGATLHEVDGGHAACVLEYEKFHPALTEAVASVNTRRLVTPDAGQPPA